MSRPSDNLPRPKVIAIVGPECTGKTTLSRTLADRFKTNWVPEYARAYLDKLLHSYQASDLTKIAHGQIRLEEEWMHDNNRILICDTNLLVIKIWSNFRYGSCDEEILSLMQSRTYDLLLLTNIDIPWENDPQREHPDKREELMNIYRQEVAASGIPFVEISGNAEQRLEMAATAINKVLGQ